MDSAVRIIFYINVYKIFSDLISISNQPIYKKNENRKLVISERKIFTEDHWDRTLIGFKLGGLFVYIGQDKANDRSFHDTFFNVVIA